MLVVLVAVLLQVGTAQKGLHLINQITNDQSSDDRLGMLLEKIMMKALLPYKCVIFITDDVYDEIFKNNFYRHIKLFLSFIMIKVEEYDDLLSPSNATQDSLMLARNEGCQMYMILISNGIQVARLLRFGERYRVINTRSKFILLFDNRLFDKALFYLWKAIVDVIFIRPYQGQTSADWFEISTVPFPAPITSIFVPRRLDTWTPSGFRKGAVLFPDKTIDLHNQALKVVVIGHLPGTSKAPESHASARTVIGDGVLNFTGAEVEILSTVAAAMNFKCDIYETDNADVDLWGRKLNGRHFNGLIGEMTSFRADIALGDLYYAPFYLDLMDLSVPYNTECLTFLTPESLTDNSWKTLILPFTPAMWGAIIICLFICALVFFALARFHEVVDALQDEGCNDQIHVKKKKVITLEIFPDLEKMDANDKYTKMKELYTSPVFEGQPSGLYQFSEAFNSFLYTYSMLLLVSLPKLPTGWSLRMLTGWYWLYCLLLVVSYRASMTAILSRPPPRVTIDTLQELINSKLSCGGWGEFNQEFFKSALDPATKQIGQHFEIVNDSVEAVDRVADATFAFYENVYFLKEALVKRQQRFQSLRANLTSNQRQQAHDIVNQDRNLHIMSDCVIKMPISLGLQKSSPIKPRVDKIIRDVIEAGLVTKWLDDAMAPVRNSQIQTETESSKALMNMKKFFGAIVALFIGYIISIVALIVEIGYFHYIAGNKMIQFNLNCKISQLVKKAE